MVQFSTEWQFQHLNGNLNNYFTCLRATLHKDNSPAQLILLACRGEVIVSHVLPLTCVVSLSLGTLKSFPDPIHKHQWYDANRYLEIQTAVVKSHELQKKHLNVTYHGHESYANLLAFVMIKCGTVAFISFSSYSFISRFVFEKLLSNLP